MIPRPSTSSAQVRQMTPAFLAGVALYPLGNVMVREKGARSVIPCRNSAVSSEKTPRANLCCATRYGSSQVSGSA